jgi:hypothetical protein
MALPRVPCAFSALSRALRTCSYRSGFVMSPWMYVIAVDKVVVEKLIAEQAVRSRVAIIHPIDTGAGARVRSAELFRFSRAAC